MTSGRRARLGTFDAERWWRPPDLAGLPAAARPDGTVAAMDELLAGFCGPGDLLLTRYPLAPALHEGLGAAGFTFDHRAIAGTPEPEEPVEVAARQDPTALAALAGTRLQPYAVLPSTRELDPRLPPAEVVARVNSKSWSNELVRRLGLPGAGTVVRSVAELSAAVARLPSAVVKDPFGVSGRGALTVGSPGILRAIERTLAAQVGRARRVELVVQEEYRVARDFSVHLYIRRDGGVRQLGLRTMVNRGLRHLGSGPADQELLTAVERGRYHEAIGAVAQALADEGYHGPVGVDSLVLEDGTLVPVLEVNARQSLGLLSLEMERTVGVPGLHAHLAQVELTVPPGRGLGDLATALGDARFRGGDRPGVLLLSGSRLTAPGGRVYFAVLCRSGEATAWKQRVATAVAVAGMTIRGASRAA